jgi:P27 family predicted phage terminase small subunit
MAVGRPPKPRHVKEAEGVTRQDRLQSPARVSRRITAADVLAPPEYLTRDATSWWNEVAPALANAGLLEHTDRHVLSLAAETWAEIRAADRVLRSEGLFQQGSRSVIPHSATRIKRDATIVFARLIAELGLSPLARTRLGVANLTGAIMAQELDRALGGAEGERVDTSYDLDADAVALPGA